MIARRAMPNQVVRSRPQSFMVISKMPKAGVAVSTKQSSECVRRVIMIHMQPAASGWGLATDVAGALHFQERDNTGHVVRQAHLSDATAPALAPDCLGVALLPEASCDFTQVLGHLLPPCSLPCGLALFADRAGFGRRAGANSKGGDEASSMAHSACSMGADFVTACAALFCHGAFQVAALLGTLVVSHPMPVVGFLPMYDLARLVTAVKALLEGGALSSSTDGTQIVWAPVSIGVKTVPAAVYPFAPPCGLKWSFRACHNSTYDIIGPICAIGLGPECAKRAS